MLIKCPECELQVSDKAPFCPHCGYPMKQGSQILAKKKPPRRKRLPNGFGQITKISGRNLSLPYRAMITIGKTDEGKPICKLLAPNAYFKTYNDAYSALLEYNKAPNYLSSSMTVKELFDRWWPSYSEKSSRKPTCNAMYLAWEYCTPIYDVKLSELRIRHIKLCVEHGKKYKDGNVLDIPITTKPRVKMLLNVMLDYALEYELIDKNYARLTKMPKEVWDDIEANKKGHISFTDEEMAELWKYQDRADVSLILIQCYSGWRPRELIELKVENCDLEQNIMRGGMKTKAGTNREVPIHPKIKPLLKRYYDEAISIGSDHVFNDFGGKRMPRICPLTYQRYLKRFRDVRSELNIRIDHTPHDGRKQFITMAKKYNVDEYAIKLIVGHAIQDITESVYTDRNFDWLYNEICKIENV